MKPFDILAILLTLAAVFSWINHRWLRLPTTIGLIMISLVMSLVLLAPVPGTDGLEGHVQAMLDELDLGQTLLHGVLSFLLFAGALHVRLHDLARQKWVIGTLASASVVGSTLLVGGGTCLLFGWLGLAVPLIHCLLLGALISPTDPIAAMGILRSAGAPKSLETQIAGESLFNDGVAVVIFLALFQAASGADETSPAGLLGLFLREAVGGLVVGLAAGWVALQMLSCIDSYKVEVLITLALACVARRGLRRTGPVTSGRRDARHSGDRDLCRRGLLHPGPRDDPRPRDSRESGASAKGAVTDPSPREPARARDHQG